MIVRDKILPAVLREPFVKAVVDIDRSLLAVDCELHIDCVEELIKNGSSNRDLWGINIYPDGHIDFIALINIRPDQKNRSMDVENQELREKIRTVVQKYL